MKEGAEIFCFQSNFNFLATSLLFWEVKVLHMYTAIAYKICLLSLVWHSSTCWSLEGIGRAVSPLMLWVTSILAGLNHSSWSRRIPKAELDVQGRPSSGWMPQMAAGILLLCCFILWHWRPFCVWAAIIFQVLKNTPQNLSWFWTCVSPLMKHPLGPWPGVNDFKGH